MRGTHSPPVLRDPPRGIIPAYAGNTRASKLLIKADRDHPRVCGEHIDSLFSESKYAGSSPRMRGTPVCVSDYNVRAGIIPAYAGNTFCRRIRVSGMRDHPRVCGEHTYKPRYDRGREGSSPRMRGTPAGMARIFNLAGIIPAYAGNTKRYYQTTNRLWDHPRVCGEHCRQRRRMRPQGGSSPRMRGTLCNFFAIRDSPRIIPAYAGNTLLPPKPFTPDRDHPRVCGEHGTIRWARSWTAGSSPRMRGTLPLRRRALLGHGIIPAYAGNTTGGLGSPCGSWDHPRVCGEHPSLALSPMNDAGSSPRMRGTLNLPLINGASPRIIPAYAGNTPARTWLLIR